MEKNNYQGALQHPIGSAFNAKSTAAEVLKGIDLTGKIAIVTGGNTGIGLETTRALAAVGATVIVPARDIEKAKKNLKGIPHVEIAPMDLAQPDTIDTFTEKFLASDRPLHLLINNAGIMWVPLQRDRRGIESQLATNYLGQYQLVARLWPALKKANGARVVNVSSAGHHMAAFNYDDPNFERTEYKTLVGYGQSKTASNLFTLELDNRAKGFNVRAYSLHPGEIAGTELARGADMELFKQLGFVDESGKIRPEILATLKTIAQGAATTVWCATSPLLHNIGGVYCEDVEIAELALENLEQGNGLGTRGVQLYSVDENNAKRLWDLSEEMTGITFELM
ncbi:SDR family NAD(P)-dependent oxidoreductase [Olivibacter domesticus]|uniref:NADP-dependent 3-hydroxy acid dehydrogenase YdfG n=1 Tax=Olivibacter domesticus TaxID=407022 RepID=A0A1H7KCL7_OLID1|nr:SDR family NAD(P)-dependent oxidoreductase [Olivibacter domesticus]SEK84593.1 NADP-dependent 3-hydroxy acid dehydrogenase YdfG [Olivibacter domesticus]